MSQSGRVRRSRRPTVCFDPGSVSRLVCESKGCTTIAGARVHWPGRTLNMCVGCTVRATNVATSMGFTLTCEPLIPNPQPPCQGCGMEVIDCGPALWLQGKKCCPDCTHGMNGPNEEHEPPDICIRCYNDTGERIELLRHAGERYSCPRCGPGAS